MSYRHLLRKKGKPESHLSFELLPSRAFAVRSETEERSPSIHATEHTSADFSFFEPGGRRSQPIQPKLTLGTPGDKYEQEADHVAPQVVMQLHQGGGLSSQPSQQKTSPEYVHKLQRRVVSQPEEAIDGADASPGLASAISNARGTGQPLDARLQQAMGQVMQADFSGVKVHTDAQADRLNQSIQAKAFTTGKDVFFRQGAYQPESRGGQELIAHELTHVVQQTGQIQRKVDFNFTVHVGMMAGLLKSHDQKFQDILDTYHTYKKAKDLKSELVYLKELMGHCEGYRKYKGINPEKDKNADALLKECEKELPKAVEENYVDALKNDRFKYITYTGGGVARSVGNLHSEKDKDRIKIMQDYGLTQGEIAAIRIYAAGDYKYINPVTAKDNGKWFNGMINQLLNETVVKDEDGKELGRAAAEWSQKEWYKKMLAKGPKPEQKQEIFNEGKSHRHMAEQGMKKLPNAPETTTYRGEGFSTEDIAKRYPQGKTYTFPAFTSTSAEEARSKKFARDSATGDKKPVFVIMTVKYGKDISQISDLKSEKEILLLPKATFKIEKVTSPQKAGDLTVVELTQIS